ncbi:MAG: hypothetical protein NVS3B10_09400 [Polyangiales bacterium]
MSGSPTMPRPLSPMARTARLVWISAAAAGLALAPAALFAQGPASAASIAPKPAGVAVGKAPPTVRGKLGYVDVQRCVGETEDGLRAAAMLKKKSDREQMRVAAVEDELRRMQDRLAELAKATDPKLQSVALDYQKRLQDYNELIKKINADIALREDELFAPIERKVRAIFERLGSEKGIDLIVDKKSIQYAKDGKVEDLTEQVIREYNWGAGPAGAGGPAANGAPGPGLAPTTNAGPQPTASAKPKPVLNPI